MLKLHAKSFPSQSQLLRRSTSSTIPQGPLRHSFCRLTYPLPVEEQIQRPLSLLVITTQHLLSLLLAAALSQ